MKLLQKEVPASFQMHVPCDYLEKNGYLFGKVNGYDVNLPLYLESILILLHGEMVSTLLCCFNVCRPSGLKGLPTQYISRYYWI